MQDDDFAAAFGTGTYLGPGPEDWLNGAAALASALAAEARVLSQAAVALRGAVAAVPNDPSNGAMGDIRRQRLALSAAADAALKAALLLEAGEVLGAGGQPAEMAARLAALAKRCGALPALLAPPLRAAALALRTDDGAARIAASALAQDISTRLLAPAAPQQGA